MPIWPIHSLLIVSLVELSLWQFRTALKQNFTAWNGEQNHHWGSTGFTPTFKDQNTMLITFLYKRCELSICASWKNSKQWILCKDWIRFQEGAVVLRERLLVPFAWHCSCSCCHDNELLCGGDKPHSFSTDPHARKFHFYYSTSENCPEMKTSWWQENQEELDQWIKCSPFRFFTDVWLLRKMLKTMLQSGEITFK